MRDDELRALVREAVSRHIGHAGAGAPAGGAAKSIPVAPSLSSANEVIVGAHPSHGVYFALVNTTDACIIEPSVACNHCNYCKSHGH